MASRVEEADNKKGGRSHGARGRDQIRRDSELQQQKQKVVISVDVQHAATYYIRSNDRMALATYISVCTLTTCVKMDISLGL